MKGSSPIYTHPHKKKRLGTKKRSTWDWRRDEEYERERKGRENLSKIEILKKYRDWSLKIIKICLLQRGEENGIKTQKNASK